MMVAVVVVAGDLVVFEGAGEVGCEDVFDRAAAAADDLDAVGIEHVQAPLPMLPASIMRTPMRAICGAMSDLQPQLLAMAYLRWR